MSMESTEATVMPRHIQQLEITLKHERDLRQRTEQHEAIHAC